MEKNFSPDTQPPSNIDQPAFWNARFAQDSDYVYGRQANAFLQQCLGKLKPGRILLVGAGEGRNAVYAAQQGWTVDAVDFSETARDKALQLAAEHAVRINYTIADATRFQTEQRYDAITFIFLHLSPGIRQAVYRTYLHYLHPGGRIIATFYTPEQLGKTSGGPKHPDWLISAEEVQEIFADLKKPSLEAGDELLQEGSKHSGIASTVRFIGKKSKKQK